MPDFDPNTATWLAACRCPGDHRFTIMDIRMDALVGDNIFHVAWPAVQCLSCTILKALARYNQLLSSFFLSDQLFPSLHCLFHDQQGDFMVDQADQLQGLDILQCQGMLFVEKRCRKLAIGSVDFSPEVVATPL